ncbi:MAG: Y-family DNA polymerase [Gammaproteobacteria bacterium]|nr:Y-family DNA polymerase [Gammaproteobacteria bacterium]
MFALVDCNSFYASCHQIFRPDLRGKPVVVLSNNDGFVIARSQQAKTLIPDLQPFFKIQPILKKHNVAIFSSNYPLYGDISNRMITTLRKFSPQTEVYSIDEAFLSFSGMQINSQEYGAHIKDTIWKEVRLPVSVGIAPTKTLAKIANHTSKQNPEFNGNYTLTSAKQWLPVLECTDVGNIWGINTRLVKRLATCGITNAGDLARANSKAIRRRTNVCVERTIEELNGHSCIPLESIPPVKKQVYCTRSFGKSANRLQPVLEGISLYASRAAEKLRQENRLATAMHVFIHTSPFGANFHSDGRLIRLPYPTDDTRIIIRFAHQIVRNIYQPGYDYLKAGVGLTELIDKMPAQQNMFHTGQRARTNKLMEAIDSINRLHGKGSVFFLAQGISKPWFMRQQFTSPEYTTRWSDIPIVEV